jgi:6-pyruvoyltetrahydropterin/6-carboxytetrahydropterin synthase
MSRLATIKLLKESMEFSAGHFTVFSSTERENLHGHSYRVRASIVTVVEEEGLSFDYRFYKDKIYKLCGQLDKTVLLAGLCQYHKITDEGDYHCVYFNNEKLMFLKRDAKILPIYNVTIEELSHWFLKNLLLDKNELERHRIQSIKMTVGNGTGQAGSAIWNK